MAKTETVKVEVEILATRTEEISLIWEVDVPKNILQVDDPGNELLREFIENHKELTSTLSREGNVEHEEYNLDEVAAHRLDEED